MTSDHDMHAPIRTLVEQLADARKLIGEITVEMNDTRRQMATNFRTLAEHVANNRRLDKENTELRDSNARLGKIYTERGAIFAELRRVLEGGNTTLPCAAMNAIPARELECQTLFSSCQNSRDVGVRYASGSVRLEPQEAWRHLDEQGPSDVEAINPACLKELRKPLGSDSGAGREQGRMVDATKPDKMSLQQKTAGATYYGALAETAASHDSAPPKTAEEVIAFLRRHEFISADQEQMAGHFLNGEFNSRGGYIHQPDTPLPKTAEQVVFFLRRNGFISEDHERMAWHFLNGKVD